MISAAKIRAVCSKILDRIVPTDTERKKLEEVINFTKSELTKKIKELNIGAEVLIAGSVGKDTWLSENHDVDIFIKFEQRYSEDKIKTNLKEIIKKTFPKAKSLQGTREYYQINHKGISLEIVPVLKVDAPKDATNSMDASPFHVSYVKDKINEGDLADEIRLFKAFAKSQGVYGAETYLSGMSGYVSELLIIHYGSFLNLVQAFENVRPKLVIDIENAYSGPEEILNSLSPSKTFSPVILIDPVMKERNAAAAMDYKTFASLVLSVRRFSRNPSESFFKKGKSSIKIIEKLSKKRGTLLVKKILKDKHSNEEVFFAKLKKRITKIFNELERKGIEVYDYGFLKDKEITIYFELETLRLTKYKRHFGPEPWISSENFDKFMKKHKNVYLSTVIPHLTVDIKRKITDVKKMTLGIINEGLKNVRKI